MPRRPTPHRPPGPKARRPDPRPSAAARGYGRKWREGERAAQLRREPLCQECKARGLIRPATDVDHVRARRKGGTEDESNLRSLCHRCHARKTYRDDGSFGRPAA